MQIGFQMWQTEIYWAKTSAEGTRMERQQTVIVIGQSSMETGNPFPIETGQMGELWKLKTNHGTKLALTLLSFSDLKSFSTRRVLGLAIVAISPVTPLPQT